MPGLDISPVEPSAMGRPSLDEAPPAMEAPLEKERPSAAPPMQYSTTLPQGGLACVLATLASLAALASQARSLTHHAPQTKSKETRTLALMPIHKG